jgi:hypothetical protein
VGVKVLSAMTRAGSHCDRWPINWQICLHLFATLVESRKYRRCGTSGRAVHIGEARGQEPNFIP